MTAAILAGTVFATVTLYGPLTAAVARLDRIARALERLTALAERGAAVSDTYATGKPLPPQDQWVPRVFVREDIFYVIDLPADDDLNRHAELNPGTISIRDVAGNVLWPEGTKQ